MPFVCDIRRFPSLFVNFFIQSAEVDRLDRSYERHCFDTFRIARIPKLRDLPLWIRRNGFNLFPLFSSPRFSLLLRLPSFFRKFQYVGDVVISAAAFHGTKNLLRMICFKQLPAMLTVLDHSISPFSHKLPRFRPERPVTSEEEPPFHPPSCCKLGVLQGNHPPFLHRSECSGRNTAMQVLKR